MLVVFSPIFVAHTKVIVGYNFAASLRIENKILETYVHSPWKGNDIVFHAFFVHDHYFLQCGFM